MKVIDCFPFFNELDLLEIRLNELKDVVDIFVITESPKTFTGKPKPLYFEENRERFKEFNIINTIYDDNEEMHSMHREHRQKQFNLDKAFELYKPGDVIMFGDCDEIPKSSVVKEALKLNGSVGLILKTYYYYLNCQRVGEESRWPSVVLIRPIEKPVYNIYRRNKTDHLIQEAGYHFSYIGDIALKLTSWGHADRYDKPPYNDPEHLKRCVEQGKDFLMRKGRRRIELEFVDDLSYLPKYVLDNLDKFNKYVR